MMSSKDAKGSKAPTTKASSSTLSGILKRSSKSCPSPDDRSSIRSNDSHTSSSSTTNVSKSSKEVKTCPHHPQLSGRCDCPKILTSNKTMTADTTPPPSPRTVTLERDPILGFGFVAGSEKPVIIRFVKEGGPSEGKLQSEDQILEINGEDVSKADRERVIELVKSCNHSVMMKACQPDHNSLNESIGINKKSAILSAAKKAARQRQNCGVNREGGVSKPRVRFAEGVTVNGTSRIPSSFDTNHVPFMPNVLKVFLENGQTKTFKYDESTLVQDVLNSLFDKLSIKYPQYYSLCVESIKIRRRNHRLQLLDPKEPLCKVASRPGSHNLRCLFRITFVPMDIQLLELLKSDPITFEYLYSQSCNDIVQERFFPELKYEISLKLASLHIYEVAMANNLLTKDTSRGLINSNSSNYKINLKQLDKQFTLSPFIPFTLFEGMKTKELFKLINHYVKSNVNQLKPITSSFASNSSLASTQTLSKKKKMKESKDGSEKGQLTGIDCKYHYLMILSQLPSFGSFIFPLISQGTYPHNQTNLTTSESCLLISRKYGISHVTNNNVLPIPPVNGSANGSNNYLGGHIKSANNPILLARIEDVTNISIVSMDETTCNVYFEIHLKQQSQQEGQRSSEPEVVPILRFCLDEKDASQLVLTIQGYHKLLTTTSGPPSGIYNATSGLSNYTDEVINVDNYKEIPIFWDLNENWNTNQVINSTKFLSYQDIAKDIHEINGHINSKYVDEYVHDEEDKYIQVSKDDDEEEEDNKFDSINSNEYIDYPSVISMEILESIQSKEDQEKDEEHKMMKINGTTGNGRRNENELSSINGAMSRVNEMKEIVTSATTYLTSQASSDTSVHTGNSSKRGIIISVQKDGEEDIDQKRRWTASRIIDKKNDDKMVASQVTLKQKMNHDATNAAEDDEDVNEGTEENNQLKGAMDSLLLLAPAVPSQIMIPVNHGINHEKRGRQSNGRRAQEEHLQVNDDDARITTGSSLRSLNMTKDDDGSCQMQKTNTKDAAADEGNDYQQQQQQFKGPFMNHNLMDTISRRKKLFHPQQQFNHHSDHWPSVTTTDTEDETEEEESVFENETDLIESLIQRLQMDTSAVMVDANSLLLDGAHGNHYNYSVPPSNGHQQQQIEEIGFEIQSDSNSIENCSSQASSAEVSEQLMEQIIDLTLIPPPCTPDPPTQMSLPSQEEDDLVNYYLSNNIEDNELNLTNQFNDLCSSFEQINSLYPTTTTNVSNVVSKSKEAPEPPIRRGSSLLINNPIKTSSVTDDVDDELLSSLIVPPPPVTMVTASNVTSNQMDDVIEKFWKVTNDVKKIYTTPPIVTKPSSPSTVPTSSAALLRDVYSSSSGDSGYESIKTPLIASPLSKDDVSVPCQEKDEKCSSLKSKVSNFESIISKNSCSVSKKPPLPPTSPSIQERRRQLLEKKMLINKSLKETPIGSVPSEECEDAALAAANEVEIEEVERPSFASAKDDQSLSLTSFATPTEEEISVTNVTNYGGDANNTSSRGDANNSFQDATSFAMIKRPQVSQLFNESSKTIQHLLESIIQIHEERLKCEDDPSIQVSNLNLMDERKEMLINETRCFVTSSKYFVKNATEGDPTLIEHLIVCLTHLDKMFKISHLVILGTESQVQVTALVDRLKDVATSFDETLKTVQNLIFCHDSSSFAAPSTSTVASPVQIMSHLMTHATSLATALSALMRTLRSLSSY